MSAPPVPDPRMDVLLGEVAAIRSQLDLVSRALGVATSERSAEAAMQPAPREAQAPAPSVTPARSQVEESSPFSWSVPSALAAPAPAAPQPAVASAPSARVEAPGGHRPTKPAPHSADDAEAVAATSAFAGPDSHPQRPRMALTPARLLAAGGAVVTILGVGFLLAVAVAAGLFGPIPRVVSLVALAAVLAVAAKHLRPRSPEPGVALAATSTAATFGVVVAATAIYQWLPPLAGVFGGIALAAAGVLVAHRWRSELLAALVHLQLLIVLPMILAPLDGITWVTFMVFVLVAYIPSVVATFANQWLRLFRFASATVLFVACLGLVWNLDGDTTTVLVGIITSFVAILIVLTLACILDEAAVALVAVVGTLLAVCALSWRLGDQLTGHPDIVVGLVLAVVLAAVATRRAGALRAVLIAGAALHLLAVTMALPIDLHISYVLLAVEALALLVAARTTRSTATWWASVAFTVAALVALVTMIPPTTVLSAFPGDAHGRWEAVAVGIVLAVVGVVHARWADQPSTRIDEEARQIAGLALAVYAGSSAIVSLGVLPGAGYLAAMTANVVTTLMWVGVAIAMLRRRSRRLAVAGYVVLAVAVVKLFLVDLHSVDGILRAVLFVVAGLGLIAAATQLRRDDSGTDSEQPIPVGAGHIERADDVSVTHDPTPPMPGEAPRSNDVD